MDRSTTLYTFMLQCPHAVQLVALLGSWDNFQTPYPMVKDAAKGPGHWTGCHAFEEHSWVDAFNKGTASGSGGLRMGETYWYYYRLDGARDYYDLVQPLTRSCPTLPGQVVNVLQVPCEVVQQGSSPSHRDSLTYLPKTLDPQDRFQIPKPVRRIDSDVQTFLGSTHATAYPLITNPRPISRAGYSPDLGWPSLSRRRRSLSALSLGERLVEPTPQFTFQSFPHPKGLLLGQLNPSTDPNHANGLFSRFGHRRARSAPASASSSQGHYGKSESASTHEDLPIRLRGFDQSPPAQENPESDRHIRDYACTRESSLRRALVDRPKPLPELPCLELELCAPLSFDLLAEFPGNGPTTPELQSPSLTCSSTSPDMNNSPYRSYEQPPQIYENDDAEKHSKILNDLLHSSTRLQSTLSDFQLYPPALRIDTTSYDIARTPAYISSIVAPFQSISLPQNQSFTGEMRFSGFKSRRSPSIRQDNAFLQKCDSGIALGEGDKSFADDLMSELSYLSGVIA